MILLSELSRRRIRSINKLIRVGRNEIVVVIRVDEDKGYIDLSKRRVSAEDMGKCDEKFNKAKTVNSILRHVGEKLDYETDAQLEDLYWKTAWYFDKKYNKDIASYDVFKASVTEPSVLDECELDEKTKEELILNIKRRLTPQPVKIRSDIEVSCYGYEGVDAVKSALKSGQACSTEDMPIKINLIAPPHYVVTTQTLERNDGVEALTNAIDTVKTHILEKGGVFKVMMEPQVVTDTEEVEFAKRLEELEKANAEVDGDDDLEEEMENKEQRQ